MKPELGPLAKCVEPVGSRVTCNPAPTDTDCDWLVFVEEAEYNDFADGLEVSGWKVGGSRIPQDMNTLPPSVRFNSFVKGVDNLIVTASPEFYMRFLAASDIAKRLNLLVKEDRIALFQAVLYGNSPDRGTCPVYPISPEIYLEF